MLLKMLKEAFTDWMEVCREYWTAEDDIHELVPKLVLHVVAVPFAITVLAVFVSRMAFVPVLAMLMVTNALVVIWFRYGGRKED